MPLAPIPSPAEIVCLYHAGNLTTEIIRRHGGAGGEDDAFVQRCVILHNSGQIDLIAATRQEAFAAISAHDFFTAQHFYCLAIPQLTGNVIDIMECCRILIEKGGTDLVATQPNAAFRAWCRGKANEVAIVIESARKGDELARMFVVFALEVSGDLDLMICFVDSFDDDRRLAGMTAMSRMKSVDIASVQKMTNVLERFVSCSNADNVRFCALLSAFDALQNQGNFEVAWRLIGAAVVGPGPATMHGLARVLLMHSALLDDRTLQILLVALGGVDPANSGTVQTLDTALCSLLGTPREAFALGFLTTNLQREELTIRALSSCVHELAHGNRQRLFELIVRWFLSGSLPLCGSVWAFFEGAEGQPFDTTVQPLHLTSFQQVFLCRKAIGYLFLKPVICCSIIVSVLRAGDKIVADEVADLLFDPMLLNYGGDAKRYLIGIPRTDSSYDLIQTALAKDKDFHAGIDAAGTIKELHPSDFQRNVVRQHLRDDMEAARAKAEKDSVLLNLVRRSTILYGKSSLVYVRDSDGSQRSVSMDMKSVSVSFEMPRHEILDPVGLDYMLRIFRVERKK